MNKTNADYIDALPQPAERKEALLNALPDQSESAFSQLHQTLGEPPMPERDDDAQLASVKSRIE
ncbi:hypothetical protein, partial [Erwinia sp. PsM31]|uniref:hypothetical protein n=1 Tax=Erwinia sp. PsM31 TaxID=3030535 RepID=UPI00263A63EF